VPISARVAPGEDQTAPRTGPERQRRGAHGRVALVCEVGQNTPRSEEGVARLGPVNRDCHEDGRQETADALIAFHEFRGIPIVGGPGAGLHLGTSFNEMLTGNLGKGLAANRGISTLLVQEKLHGLPELEGRGIQIAQGAETFFLALTLGCMDDLCNHEVEEIQDVIHRNDFAGMGQGQQGG
jgi:hypothetical protein